MSSYGYLIDDLAGLLLKYARLYELDTDKALMAKLQTYGVEKKLKYEDWEQLLDELAEITQNPAIGFELGQLAEIKHGGILGYLISNCENLGQASLQFARYQKLLNGVEPKLSSENFNYRITWPSTDKKNYRSDECLIAALINIGRTLTGVHDFYPTQIGFQHAEPAYLAHYRSLLGNHIVFDQEATFIEYPIDYFSLRIQQADSGLQKILEQQANALLSVFKSEDDFETQLRDAVLEILRTGEASLEKLSNVLDMPPRTLQRRLQEKGMSFSVLLEDSRKQLAKDYLKNEELSLTEVSFLLAYSEQSAFTRAFKKWFSVSPKDYRKRLLKNRHIGLE